jgi:hypothetical protein
MLLLSIKNLTIENNTFIDCKSNYGGAIYANYDPLLLIADPSLAPSIAPSS